MRVLLVGIGEEFHIGACFRRGLEQLSYQVAFLDEASYMAPLRKSRLHRAVFHLLGRRPLTYWRFNADLQRLAIDFRPQVVLIVKGMMVAPQTLERIKHHTRAYLINFATDDPFNRQNSSSDILSGIPLYDLYVTPRRAVIEDLKRAGAQRVAFVRFGYDPLLHHPERPMSAEETARWTSDVIFAGGGDPDRYPYFRALVERGGINLHLYGGYWDKDQVLQPYWRGYARGRDYRLALGCSRIAICLVRQANRDGHVMRSFEIAACGAFLLAERTRDHLELFEEDREAAFFSSLEEMVDKVEFYLKYETNRRAIAEAGYRRVCLSGNTYRDRVFEILSAAGVVGKGE